MRLFPGMLLALAGHVLTTPLPAEEALKGWAQWLGPMRTGHTAEPSGQWPPRKLWQRSFGESDGSPIVVNGKIYLTTLDGERTKVTCVEAATGEVVWQGHSPGGRYGRHSTGDKGFYVGPLSTPACDGSRLFTLSVDGDLWCWDVATGRKKWSLNLYENYRMGPRKHIRDYGYTGSPLLHGPNVWVEVGGTRGAVMAFDRETGRETAAWGEGQVGHSGGPTAPDARVFFGIDKLWIEGREIPWPTQYACNISTPAVSGNLVVASAAYNLRRTVCYRDGKEIWRSKYHCKTTSPVIHPGAGQVYLPEVGRCLDLETGEPLWTFPRASSVIVTGDDRLIVFDRVIRLLDLKGTVLHELETIDKEWPSGAFGEGYLIFKHRSTVVCYSVAG
ncbi:PQQ-binding-like beta-propeller repeat protein [Haloferula sp. A504]|uniref:outer membrane protein assembly factor BamB family protein n=1 Tax=Haloferula sp. A504 TaxID=3373601 RepID=UPI0031C3129C|nr:PQQ-binding-like beta-propeller repeat protein [Verrucomicrobiaceae bacterium E54]